MSAQLMEQGGIVPSTPSSSSDSEVSRYRLPKEKELPAIIREVVMNAPQSRKTAAFVATLSPLCAMAPRVRLRYCYDSRPSALLLQVLIEGEQSSGKSFAADIESLIMDKTLKARDKEMRRMEQEYREKKKRRKANEKLEEEPKTTVRVVPATISKTVLTKRADMFERVYGDTLPFWMFAEELAQVTDAGKQGYSNLRTIMRTAYDLGSLFGLDFASDNSYAAIVDINICSMFCATPAAIDDYFDKKAVEGGNITRTIICTLEEDLGDDGAIFRLYSDEQQALIDSVLQKMLDRTYAPDGSLMPREDLDMSWLDPTVRKWCRQKGKDATLNGSRALNVFRKRSSTSAFRTAALCYYLYRLEGLLEEDKMQKLSRQIYLYMADFVLEGMLRRWGAKYEDLNAKREAQAAPEKKPVLFDQLSDPFTRNQLIQLEEMLGMRTPDKVFLSKWKALKVIRQDPQDANLFHKIKKGGAV